jgi:hypothetical protein
MDSKYFNHAVSAMSQVALQELHLMTILIGLSGLKGKGYHYNVVIRQLKWQFNKEK